jgi:hypothetical protein
MRLVNVSEARTEYTSSQVSLQVQTPAATTNQGPLDEAAVRREIGRAASS